MGVRRALVGGGGAAIGDEGKVNDDGGTGVSSTPNLRALLLGAGVSPLAGSPDRIRVSTETGKNNAQRFNIVNILGQFCRGQEPFLGVKIRQNQIDFQLTAPN